MWQLCAFGCALLLFHASEFLLAAVFMRDQLSLRSLLFSWPYTCAMAAGVAEFVLEAALLPGLKQQLRLVSWAGLALVVAGEALRKAAMVTAATNFTHDIASVKRPTHRLITHGVYRHMRHPGYAGWFLWAVATQLLLVNPLCSVAFAVVAWRFFQRRISYEDWTLRRFFGAQHAALHILCRRQPREAEAVVMTVAALAHRGRHQPIPGPRRLCGGPGHPAAGQHGGGCQARHVLCSARHAGRAVRAARSCTAHWRQRWNRRAWRC